MDVERVSPQVGGLIGDVTTAPMEEEADCILENRKYLDEHSSAIADKLLQGWALMNEHCPQCYTPLVRNKQKRLYCVACRQWVLTEVEAQGLQKTSQKAAVALEANNIEENQPCGGIVLNSSIPSPSGVNHSRVVSLRAGDEDASEERHAKRFAADTAILNGNSVTSAEPAPGGVGELLGLYGGTKVLDDGSAGKQSLLAITSAKPSPILPRVDLPLNMDAVLSTTLATAVQKVEEIRRLIAATQNINDLRQLLDTLLKFLEVVSMLKSFGIP